MTGTVTATMMWPSMQPVMREVEGDSDIMRYDGATVTGTWSSGDWDPLPFDITLDAAPFAPEGPALGGARVAVPGRLHRDGPHVHGQQPRPRLHHDRRRSGDVHARRRHDGVGLGHRRDARGPRRS